MATRLITKPKLHLLDLISKHILNLPILKTHTFSTIPNPNPPKSPPISQQSNYKKLVSLVDIFQKHGFSQPHLHDLLSKNRNLLDFNADEVEESLSILCNFEIPRNLLVSLICNCPGVLELGFIKKWEIELSKMGIGCVSPSAIRSVLEHSRKFGIGPVEFSRSVMILKSLGFNDGTICKVLEDFPNVAVLNEHELRRKNDFLIGIIGESCINRVCNSYPWILEFDVDHRLKPLFGEFRKLGFSENVIHREILRDPTILSMELGELSRCLEFLRSLKCRVPIKDKIYSQGEFRAGFEVKLKVDCLCKYGLIRTEAFSILWREPRSIVYEVADIEKKIDFLLHKTMYGVEWLVRVPEYLGVNFEKQIVPRCNVIDYLRSKGGLGDTVGLNDLIKPSRLKFYNLYVKPYPECEKMFGRCSGDVEAKPRHPVELWEMFKPQRHPESHKDIQNIRLCMEELA